VAKTLKGSAPPRAPAPQEAPPALGEGEVVIVIAGERHVLKPTLFAAKRVSAAFGGFMPGWSRLAAQDLDACIVIVAAGLGAETPQQEAAAAEIAYRAGMADLIGPLGRFLAILANGGREPPKLRKVAPDPGN